MVGTVTVIGIFSFYCILVRILAIMVPFLNAIWIHECLVFHVVPDLLTRALRLVSQLLDTICFNGMSKERQLLKVEFKQFTF